MTERTIFLFPTTIIPETRRFNGESRNFDDFKVSVIYTDSMTLSSARTLMSCPFMNSISLIDIYSCSITAFIGEYNSRHAKASDLRYSLKTKRLVTPEEYSKLGEDSEQNMFIYFMVETTNPVREEIYLSGILPLSVSYDEETKFMAVTGQRDLLDIIQMPKRSKGSEDIPWSWMI